MRTQPGKYLAWALGLILTLLTETVTAEKGVVTAVFVTLIIFVESKDTRFWWLRVVIGGSLILGITFVLSILTWAFSIEVTIGSGNEISDYLVEATAGWMILSMLPAFVGGVLVGEGKLSFRAYLFLYILVMGAILAVLLSLFSEPYPEPRGADGGLFYFVLGGYGPMHLYYYTPIIDSYNLLGMLFMAYVSPILSNFVFYLLGFWLGKC